MCARANCVGLGRRAGLDWADWNGGSGGPPVGQRGGDFASTDAVSVGRGEGGEGIGVRGSGFGSRGRRAIRIFEVLPFVVDRKGLRPSDCNCLLHRNFGSFARRAWRGPSPVVVTVLSMVFSFMGGRMRVGRTGSP